MDYVLEFNTDFVEMNSVLNFFGRQYGNGKLGRGSLMGQQEIS